MASTPVRMQLFPAVLVLIAIFTSAVSQPSHRSKRDVTSDLFDAISLGDEAKAIRLIKNGANINATVGYGDFPMHKASENDLNEVVEFLIKRGADVNARDGYGFTALHEAAWNDNEVVVETLIRHGADVNAKAYDGYAPLHSAARQGLDKIIDILISHGADPNIKKNDGETPLHFAAYHNHYMAVEILLRHGADPNLKDNYGNTPRSHTLQLGHYNIVNLFDHPPTASVTPPPLASVTPPSPTSWPKKPAPIAVQTETVPITTTTTTSTTPTPTTTSMTSTTPRTTPTPEMVRTTSTIRIPPSTTSKPTKATSIGGIGYSVHPVMTTTEGKSQKITATDEIKSIENSSNGLIYVILAGVVVCIVGTVSAVFYHRHKQLSNLTRVGKSKYDKSCNSAYYNSRTVPVNRLDSENVATQRVVDGDLMFDYYVNPLELKTYR